jgi:UDP-glucose 4-epimerase
MEVSPTNEYNLGNGNGYSVKEVIAAVEKVTGKIVPVVMSERRAGDPARLVASSEKAKSELGWVPKYPEIEQIITSAWEAEVNPPTLKNKN